MITNSYPTCKLQFADIVHAEYSNGNMGRNNRMVTDYRVVLDDTVRTDRCMEAYDDILSNDCSRVDLSRRVNFTSHVNRHKTFIRKSIV